MNHTYDKYLSCPYNPAHVCLRGRIQGHLMKCRNQCDEKGKALTAVCCFNATHVVPEKEIEVRFIPNLFFIVFMTVLSYKCSLHKVKLIVIYGTLISVVIIFRYNC